MTFSSLPKRSYAGAALAGTLAANLSSSGTSFASSTSLSTWLDVTTSAAPATSNRLVVAFGFGTATEEKILCTLSGTTFTVVQRGYDGTTAQAWTTGALFVPVWSATEAAEANAAVQALSTIITNTGTATAPSAITVSNTAGSVGTGTQPAAIDHSHNITAASLNTWLTTSASGTLPSTLTVPLTILASGSLPTSVSTSNLWNLGTWSSGSAPISTAITGYNDYIIVVSGNAKASVAANLYLNVNVSASSSMTSPTSVLATATYATTAGSTAIYNLSCSGAYSPGSTTTFYAQAALTASSGTATTNSVTVTVIGIN